MASVNLSTQPSFLNKKYDAANTSTSKFLTETADSGKNVTTVSISGRAIMLSRLFHSSDSNTNLAVASSTTTGNTSGSVFDFLTTEDRKFLSQLYEHTNSNGIDPLEVDNVAFDLGVYRRYGPGGPPDTTGLLFDLQGNPIVSEFNPSDEAIAQRILTSKAMGDTEVDHGFLRAIFNPNRTPVHASNFNFLQHVVFDSSAKGGDGAVDPNAIPIVRPKKEDVQPLALDGVTIPNERTLMLSQVIIAKKTSASGSVNSAGKWASSNYLHSSDKDLFSQLYSQLQKQNGDLSKVDHLAGVLGIYRMREQLLSQSLISDKLGPS